MKFNLDHAYMEKIKYVTIGFVILYLIYSTINHLGIVTGFVGDGFSFLIRIFSPLLWGLVIAYLMYPLVKYFERLFNRIRIPKSWQKYDRQKKITYRVLSLLLTILIFVVIIFAMAYSVFVMIDGSVKEFEIFSFIDAIGENINNFSNYLLGVDETLKQIGISASILDEFQSVFMDGAQVAKDLLDNLAERITTIGHYVIDISFGFVFAINFIMNEEYFLNLSENLTRLVIVKESKRKDFNETLEQVHHVFMHFIRAKILDLTLVSFVTIVALLMIDFDYPVLVGAFAGYCKIVPYLGTYVGITPALIIAFVNGGWQEALFVGVYVLGLQQLYHVFIGPKIQGKSVGLHPVFVLISMFVFANIFGLIGVVLAIPFGGIAKIFILRWVRWRKERKGIELIEVSPKKTNKNVELPSGKE